jgi:hypothetical protein
VDLLNLRRCEGDDAADHLAPLVESHLDLVQRVEDAIASKNLAEVLGGGDDVIGLAVRELVVLHGERLVAADGVDLEVDEVILVVVMREVRGQRGMRGEARTGSNACEENRLNVGEPWK